MATTRPLIGVATFLFSPSLHAQKFLLGKRLGSHGAGTYALPGGHLEHGESFESCAAREILEETGLTVDEASLAFLSATNDVMEEGRHYVTVFMVGRVSELDEREGREAVALEREKCEGWEWVSWGQVLEMAKNGNDGGQVAREERVLFQPIRDLMEQRPGVVPRCDSR